MKRFLSLIVATMVVLGGCANQKMEPPKPHKPTPTPPPTEQEGEYDVYLLIGQSNMAGRGTMIAGDEQPIEGVYILDTEGNVVPATSPLNQYSSIRKEMKHQQINPGVGFSKKVHAATGRKILLVVNARGGSNINEWAKGKATTFDYTDAAGVKSSVSLSFYAEAVRRTKQAQAYGELKGILWHQGESNSSNPSGYMDKLKALVSGLRSELNAPAVPFIAGEIAPWHKNKDKFNPIIHTITTEIPYSDWVSSEGCDMLIDESDPHFGRNGQLLIGERYAEKILKMVYGK